MFYRFLMLLFLFCPGLVLAHKLAPVSLKIEQIDTGFFLVQQKYPALGVARSLPDIRWPDVCIQENQQLDRFGSAIVESFRLNCVADVLELQLSGFQANKNALLLDYKQQNGVWKRQLVTADAEMKFGEPESMVDWANRFVKQGFTHVIEGLDHVLFLLMLPFLFLRLRHLLLAATLFSLCHALSVFSLALTGLFVPAGFIEPLIAASIFALAWQVQSRKTSASINASSRDYCLVGFWGLVHGAGFASQTAAYGFEVKEWLSWLYLLVFNFGVEIAQLVLAVAGFYLYQQLQKHRNIVVNTCTYCAGTVSVCWCLQRLFV